MEVFYVETAHKHLLVLKVVPLLGNCKCDILKPLSKIQLLKGFVVGKTKCDMDTAVNHVLVEKASCILFTNVWTFKFVICPNCCQKHFNLKQVETSSI